MPKAAPRKLTDQELVDHFGSGTEERQYMTVVDQSANFIVFKVAGHKAWSNVMDPSVYVPVRYILAARGDTWLRYSGTREWEGRTNKKLLKEALRRSELTKAVYTGDLDAPMCEECDEEMHRGSGLDGNKRIEYWHCDGCGWSVDID